MENKEEKITQETVNFYGSILLKAKRNKRIRLVIGIIAGLLSALGYGLIWYYYGFKLALFIGMMSSAESIHLVKKMFK